MLKYKLETLEGVDEAHQSLYKEAEGGGYVLEVEGAVSADKFSAVNQRAIDAAEEAARRRRTAEKWKALGESPEAVREAMDSKGKPDKDHEAILAQLRDEYEGKIKAAQERLSGVVARGAKAEMKAALAAASFHPEIVDDIAATAMGRVNVDESGEIRILSADMTKPLAGSGADGYATFADLAKELAAAKPSFLIDGGKGGGGKPPASGGAGKSKKTVTRSEFDTMSQAERATFAKEGGKVSGD